MKTFVVTVLLLACSVLPMAAQAPAEEATREEVTQFLTLMNVRQQMNVMVTGLFDQLTKTIFKEYKQEHPNATAAELADVEQALLNFSKEKIQNFPFDELIDGVVPIYQRHLTHADMQAVIAFYSSAAGQKFVREAPAMMNEGMQVGSAIMEKHLPEFRAQMEEVARKATQAGHALRK